mmetsp:Transcript_25246/g.86460  ORF Transcript_25246/g.86460 Transcript_25246/m.86460 type:complete len:380 (-) Transcript_25246:2043-3182(-)
MPLVNPTATPQRPRAASFLDSSTSPSFTDKKRLSDTLSRTVLSSASSPAEPAMLSTVAFTSGGVTPSCGIATATESDLVFCLLSEGAHSSCAVPFSASSLAACINSGSVMRIIPLRNSEKAMWPSPFWSKSRTRLCSSHVVSFEPSSPTMNESSSSALIVPCPSVSYLRNMRCNHSTRSSPNAFAMGCSDLCTRLASIRSLKKSEKDISESSEARETCSSCSSITACVRALNESLMEPSRHLTMLLTSLKVRLPWPLRSKTSQREYAVRRSTLSSLRISPPPGSAATSLSMCTNSSPALTPSRSRSAFTMLGATSVELRSTSSRAFRSWSGNLGSASSALFSFFLILLDSASNSRSKLSRMIDTISERRTYAPMSTHAT